MTKTCKICGIPCSSNNPCRSQLVVPRELGGSNTPDNTILVCSKCSGSQNGGVSVPSEQKSIYEDRDKLFGMIDEYLNKAYSVE